MVLAEALLEAEALPVVSNMDDYQKLLSEYLDPIYRFVFGMVLDKDNADDIVQEVFIKVWNKRSSLRKDQSPKAYIYQIARNATVDFFRKKRVEVFSSFDQDETVFEDTLESEELQPDEEFEKAETVEEVRKLLEQLPPKYREVVVLHVHQEQTFQEISDLTGVPMNTVKSVYRRALKMMHQKL